MTQKIHKGFPQFHSFAWLRSKFYGTLATQSDQSKTDINLQSDTVGDSINIDSSNLSLLTVMRDGAFLHLDQGYELIAPNTIRVWPGLLNQETVEFMFFTGVNGIMEYIPEAPPAPSQDGYAQTIDEALVYTDNSETPVNAFAPILFGGKTRISTHFQIDNGKIDVYVNGGRVGIHSGVWSVLDANTIELDQDYSADKMKIEIVKQRIGL
ncbi:MAG: hypothetical protein PHY47_00245 [Lachnospiraceae bacterium]|nr:hypothetical protein [Lachnospiraceae bacterium]